jgi:hypothetical protein
MKYMGSVCALVLSVGASIFGAQYADTHDGHLVLTGVIACWSIFLTFGLLSTAVMLFIFAKEAPCDTQR